MKMKIVLLTAYTTSALTGNGFSATTEKGNSHLWSAGDSIFTSSLALIEYIQDTLIFY